MNITGSKQSTPKASVFNHPRFVEGSVENQDTLGNFVQGLEELQATNPEILGATLFGSRLGGAATGKSDVDCTIFIDADQVLAQGVSIEFDYIGRARFDDDDQLRRDFREQLGKILAEKTGKDPQVIQKGIFIEAISDSIIQAQIDEYVNYVRSYGTYIADRDSWENQIARWRPGDALENAPQQPEQRYLAVGITGLFHPELTHGLALYRKLVVDQLSQAGPYGETAWRFMLESVRWGEKHSDLQDPFAYPINLQQAQEWYGEGLEQVQRVEVS